MLFIISIIFINERSYNNNWEAGWGVGGGGKGGGAIESI